MIIPNPHIKPTSLLKKVRRLTLIITIILSLVLTTVYFVLLFNYVSINFTLFLAIDVGLCALLAPRLANRFEPMASYHTLMPVWEEAMRSGDNVTLLSMIENTLVNMPYWETWILIASSLIQIGKFKEAEQIIQRAVNQLSLDTVTGPDTVVLDTMFTLLGVIQMGEGHFLEAKNMIKAGLNRQKRYPFQHAYSQACLYLNQPAEALPYINAAAQQYTRSGKRRSGYNLALKAWAIAEQGNFVLANKLMFNAFAEITIEHHADQADLTLIAAYVDRLQGRSPRSKLEKVIALYPQSCFSLYAQRELDLLV